MESQLSLSSRMRQAIHRTRLSLYLSWETELVTGQPTVSLVNGVKGIGTNVDLMNTLTPFTPAVYYYDKIPPIDVELKVTKALTDPTNSRTLRAGDFTFNIKNADSTTPSY